MKRAIFFDVDDTLYDHLAPFRQAIMPWTKGNLHFPYEQAYHRMRYYSDKLSLELGGAGQMELGAATEQMRRQRFQFSLAEFNIHITEVEAESIQQAYLSCQFAIEPFPNIIELILELKDLGISIGLITNGAESHQWKKIKALKLEQYIPLDWIFVSGSYYWDKPDSRLFQLVNNRTRTLAEHCTFVGDSWRNDVMGALSANWNVIWFNHRNQQAGQDGTPTAIVTNVHDLRSQLLQLAMPVNQI